IAFWETIRVEEVFADCNPDCLAFNGESGWLIALRNIVIFHHKLSGGKCAFSVNSKDLPIFDNRSATIERMMIALRRANDGHNIGGMMGDLIECLASVIDKLRF